MKRTLLSILITLSLLLLAGCGEDTAEPSAPATGGMTGELDPSQVTIAVNMKGIGTESPFWAAIEQGAMEKGKELGVNVTVLSPPTAGDVQAQIQQVEDQLANGVSAISIAPTDPDALVPVLRKAKESGVPVLFFDTFGKLDDTTFIGTNNAMAAGLGAEYICSHVEKGSEVAILHGILSQSTGKARAEGSKAGLEGCGMKIVAEQSAEWDRAKAQSVMAEMLSQYPNLKAVFAANDNMALGAIEAIKAAGLNGQITIVGFDTNAEGAAAVLMGDMAATVAQNPANMGAFAVENALKLLKGEILPDFIDTGTELVDKNNAGKYQ